MSPHRRVFFEEVFGEIAWKGSEKMTKAFAKDTDQNSFLKASSYFPLDVHTFLTAISATKKTCDASKEPRRAERYPQ